MTGPILDASTWDLCAEAMAHMAEQTTLVKPETIREALTAVANGRQTAAAERILLKTFLAAVELDPEKRS
jgi:uncharacterized membrane protein